MTDKEKSQIDLDVFFEDAKKTNAEMSETLMANILADAGEISADRTFSSTPGPVQADNWWRGLFRPLGGIQGMAAVAFCAVVGVAFGYTGTDTLQSIPGVGDIVASISSDPLDEFSYAGLSDFNDFLAEG